MKYLLLLLILPLLLPIIFLKIKVFISYVHDGKDDELILQFKTFFNLIKYKITIPVLAVDDESPSVVYKEKRESALGTKEISEKYTLHRFLDDMKHFERFVKHVIGLHTIVRKFMSKVSVNEFHWKTLIGAGDAAITGSASGLLWAIKGNTIGIMSHYMQVKAEPKIYIEPEFQQLMVKTSFKCMVSFRIGHAILAGIKVLRHWKKGRTLFKVNTDAGRDMNV
ncbi:MULTISPECIES: DUF2953 domain-containing protein [Bacillaceae]|uniref:DUF2953 domain-containing protein n=1 Tax=Evansella alkalicola TaxID=745819 RepID=A0ABS6JRD4_9BACI|nr:MULTISPECIES: DUF2953 domain-containing protein [Bacillaceae]MBU9721119.1 DUF2953 domain-containing protein [Bacillus alkalicola]